LSLWKGHPKLGMTGVKHFDRARRASGKRSLFVRRSAACQWSWTSCGASTRLTARCAQATCCPSAHRTLMSVFAAPSNVPSLSPTHGPLHTALHPSGPRGPAFLHVQRPPSQGHSRRAYTPQMSPGVVCVGVLLGGGARLCSGSVVAGHGQEHRSKYSAKLNTQ